MNRTSTIFYILGLLFSYTIQGQDTAMANNHLQFEEINFVDDDGLHSWSDIEQFYQGNDGALWVQINEGIYRINGHSAINVSRYLSNSKIRLDDQPVTKFLFDDDDKLWLGRRKGLFKIDLTTKTIEKIVLDHPGNPQNWRNYILELECSNDTVYVGTANGLYLIEKKSGQKLHSYLTHGKDIKHRESNTSVQSIYPNLEKDAIWVALMDGFYRIDKKNGNHDRYLVTDIWPDSLAHNFSKGQPYKDQIFFPSYGLGMVGFDFVEKTFQRYPTTTEHAHDYRYNIIRSAIKLSDSTLLINSTKLGNAIFNMDTKTYQWLPSPEIFKEGVFLYMDRSGYVWSGKRGRLFRTAKPVVERSKEPAAFLDIASVFANGTLINRPSLDGYGTIALGDEQENLRLNFSLTQPQNHHNHHYEYRLNQGEWSPIERPNELELFGIAKGQQTIQIRAKDNNGAVLAQQQIQVHRTLPFYKSPLFVCGLILLLGLLAIFTIRYVNQKAITKKLKALDAAKTHFFTNISHELRTPLTLIKGPIEEQLRQAGPAKENKSLQLALKNTDRLQELVNQILDLSKLESGQYKLSISQHLLPQFLKSLASSFKYPTQKKHQDFRVFIDDNLKTAWFDKEVLQKIVTNLLDNAIKYSPKGALIAFFAKAMGNNLVLSFTNTGTSLTKEELQQVFQRYYRCANAEAGTGIGLALTKELAERHKGSISVKSIGNKVVFKVQIPISRSAYDQNELKLDTAGNGPRSVFQDHPTTSSTKSQRKTSQKKDAPILLLVEDHTELQHFLAGLFKKDFNVLVAPNGKLGFRLAKNHVPDIIITDLMMPNEDGIAMTRNCKSEDTTSHIPIIMLTAKAGDANELMGLETGADAYLTKPFNTEILRQKVANLLKVQKKLQKRFSREVMLTPREISINSYDERFLTMLQKVLDQQLTNSDFSAETFSRTLGMSRMQLHRKLKAMTGQSTSEFIRTQRLKLAADLLKNSKANVSEIGYRVGFNNHSYFSKCFKEHYGTTPNVFTGV